MNRKLLWIAAFLVVVSLLFWWRIQSQAGIVNNRRRNNAVIKTAVPKRETIVNTLSYTGDVLAIQQAIIVSKVTGSLAKVLVDIGDRVREGQLLAVIDTTELVQQHLQTLATYRNAKFTYDRVKELFNQKLTSQQELDNSDAAQQVAKANYEAAALRLGYAQITAPFAGVITKRSQDPGALITANTTQLFTLMDLSTVKVAVNILEKDVALLKIGMNAIVSTDAYPGRVFYGKVNRFSSALDPASRTMLTEIRVPNPGELLKPGMYVKTSIDVETRENALTIPPQAILRNGDNCYIFTIRNNVAKRIPVTIGKEFGDKTEIVDGLTESDSIAVVGAQFLSDGGNVSVQQR